MAYEVIRENLFIPCPTAVRQARCVYLCAINSTRMNADAADLRGFTDHNILLNDLFILCPNLKFKI